MFDVHTIETLIELSQNLGGLAGTIRKTIALNQEYIILEEGAILYDIGNT